MSGLMLFDFLAEARIEEAIAQGMLDNLPCAGKPLILADDRLVPEGLRAAYRILMNARCVPPEVDARREVAALVVSLATLDDDALASVRRASPLPAPPAGAPHGFVAPIRYRLR